MKNNIFKVIFSIILPCLLLLGLTTNCKEQKTCKITLTNELNVKVDTSLIEIPFDSITNYVGKDNFKLVCDGKELPYQISKNYLKNTKVLLCPLSFNSHESKQIEVVLGKPVTPAVKVYGHVHKDRADDFAWENNRNGYRVFGPALEAKGEISGGIDFFSKRTTKIVLDQWYAAEEAHPHSYHIDRGEGMDFYAVGPSLGLGGCAPILGDKLCLSKNYTSVDILENGPLRMAFTLHYAPFAVGKEMVSASKTVICDAYSSLNHYIVNYDFNSDNLNVGVGCVIRKETNPKYTIKEDKLLSYCGPEIQGKGTIYVGLLSLSPFVKTGINDGHLIGELTINKGESFDYYSGGCWNKGYYNTYNSWNSYLERELNLLSHPIKVEFSK